MLGRELDFTSAYFAGCGTSVQIANLSGYTAQTFQGLLSNGDEFFGNIDNGDGTFHTVTITGMNSNGEYTYNDLQNRFSNQTMSPSGLHSGIRVFGNGH